MPSPRLWRMDLTAGGLLLAGMLGAVALFSYDPADVAGNVAPLNPTPQNLLGIPGAALAAAVIAAFGVSVPLLLAAWFVAVLWLFLRNGWLTWSLRLLGWLVLIPSVAVVADITAFAWPGLPPEGPGGSLGAFLSRVLQKNLEPLGQVILLSCLFCIGTVLALDFLLLALFRVVLVLVRVTGVQLDWPRRRSPLLIRRSVPIKITKQKPIAPEAFEVLPELAESDRPVESSAIASTPKGPKGIPIHHHGVQAQSAEEGMHPRTLPMPVLTMPEYADFELPSLSLLEDPPPFDVASQDEELRERAALLEKTFADFGLNVHVVGINTGPVITQFEVALETGLRVNKVTSLSDDIALNLRVPSVRILAPIPGKGTVGVEVPNEQRAVVCLKEVIQTASKKIAKMKIPLFLGKDGEGRPLVGDLADMPHLLIAGSTGTGKSVCLNSIILSILLTRRPDQVRMIMIDPKGGVELSEYGRIPHLMYRIVSDKDKAEAILSWAVDKMEERYDLLRRARVRNIASYNDLKPDEIFRRVAPQDEEEKSRVPVWLPYIVIFIDELSDLMMQQKKKEVEGYIIRLAQKSRAAGIHLVVATQKPIVEVITGLIKSNLPSRICFKVSNKSDSRVVLDEGGADKLMGKGDMLFLPPGTSTLVRAQGTYASDAEIGRVVGYLDCEPHFDTELMQLKPAGKGGPSGLQDRLREDDLYETAVDVIMREGRGSTSLLQRASRHRLWPRLANDRLDGRGRDRRCLQR